MLNVSFSRIKLIKKKHDVCKNMLNQIQLTLSKITRNGIYHISQRNESYISLKNVYLNGNPRKNNGKNQLLEIK